MCSGYIVMVLIFILCSISTNSINTHGAILLTEKEQEYLIISPQSDKSNSQNSGVDQQEAQQNTEINSELKKFNQNLLKICKELQDEIAAAQKALRKKQERERKELTKQIINEQNPQKARNIINAIRKAVIELNNPEVAFVEVKEEWRILLPGERNEDKDVIKTKDGIPGGPGVIAVITRQNAGQVLAEAEREYQKMRRIRRINFIPLEIQQQHKLEWDEYKKLEDFSKKANTLRKEANRAVRLLANQPNLLQVEKTKWMEEFNLLIETAKKDLENVRRKYPSIRRVEPLNYSIRSSSVGPKSESVNGKVKLVVQARVRTDYFTLSQRESKKLDISVPFTVGICVFDLDDFKLILKGGRILKADEFVDTHTWDGHLLDKSTMDKIQAKKLNADRLCAIKYDYQQLQSSTMAIKIGWILDPKDCKETLELQFDEFEPAPIPSGGKALLTSEQEE